MGQPDHFEALNEVVGNVSRETFDRLVAFEARFRQWNSRINLVADSTLADFWTRHILDSAQLVRIAPSSITRWLDLGSGGGFPGLVVAFLLPGATRIALVESNRKKAGFLSAIAGEFNLAVDVYPVRIEQAPQKVPRADVVSARALASLPTLLNLASPWLLFGGKALFHKGRDYRAEVAESRRKWRFDLIEHPSVSDPDAAVLEIFDLKSAGQI